jgi:hypothetical protein
VPACTAPAAASPAVWTVGATVVVAVLTSGATASVAVFVAGATFGVTDWVAELTGAVEAVKTGATTASVVVPTVPSVPVTVVVVGAMVVEAGAVAVDVTDAVELVDVGLVGAVVMLVVVGGAAAVFVAVAVGVLAAVAVLTAVGTVSSTIWVTDPASDVVGSAPKAGGARRNKPAATMRSAPQRRPMGANHRGGDEKNLQSPQFADDSGLRGPFPPRVARASMSVLSGRCPSKDIAGVNPLSGKTARSPTAASQPASRPRTRTGATSLRGSRPPSCGGSVG